MVYHRHLLAGLFIFSMLSACSGETMPTSNNADQSLQYKTVEWIDLMPARDLEELLNPPDYVDEISEASIDDTPASMLKSSITEPADRYQQALAPRLFLLCPGSALAFICHPHLPIRSY